MVNLAVCAQRADAGLGRANGKLCLGCVAPALFCDAQGGDEDQEEGGP
jgi:hypothetical protein